MGAPVLCMCAVGVDHPSSKHLRFLQLHKEVVIVRVYCRCEETPGPQQLLERKHFIAAGLQIRGLVQYQGSMQAAMVLER